MEKRQNFPGSPTGINLQAVVVICLVIFIFSTAARANTTDAVNETVSASDIYAYTGMFTRAEEDALGRRLAYCYGLRQRQVSDERYKRRIEHVAARLESSAGLQKLRVTVVEGEVLEAVSFPGGRVFITRGLIDACKSDDELAAVLAHEAAHCSDHHLLRLITEALNLPLAEREGFPTREEIVKGVVLNFRFPSQLKSSAEALEREADRKAIAWLRAARYREGALGEVLRLAASRMREDGEVKNRRSLESRLVALNSF